MNNISQVKTMREIGKKFGVSSHKIGKALLELGLRTEEGKPSHIAFDGNYCAKLPSNGEYYLYGWRADLVVPMIEALGYPLLDNPTE